VKPRHAPRRTAQRGFTLVELAITAALLVLLLSSAILAASGGRGAFQATQDASDVEARVRRALDRVAVELLSAGASELQPDPAGDFGTHDLLFRNAVGVVGTVVQWGPQVRIAREYALGELDDGLDNDGDGLVDEGALVLTRDVGGTERRVVLCNGVAELLEGETADGADDNGNGVKDEAGFNVHRQGDVLFVRLSVEGTTEQGSIVRTLETAVRLRN
jgi:prepilin-type N-terminal cleavage/methylation domain-containing protein